MRAKGVRLLVKVESRVKKKVGNRLLVTLVTFVMRKSDNLFMTTRKLTSSGRPSGKVDRESSKLLLILLQIFLRNLGNAKFAVFGSKTTRLEL